MQSISKINARNVISSLLSIRRCLATDTTTPWRTAYGGKYRVTLIHGDGVGPELMQHIKAAIRCVRAPIDFEEIPLSSNVASDEMFERAVTAVKRNGIALKGNIASQNTTQSLNVLLRTRLDLYASVVRCKSSALIPTRHSDIDILVIRQNTEGEYSSLEHESVPGVVESLKIITRAKSLKIARFAFEMAKTKERKKVTAVHKANIMKLSDGLFIECCREVASEYPNIKFETMIVDNTCMQLVNRPAQFDVMVMPNLYGNIIANVCTGLVGGSGFVAGSNYGDKYAVFEQGTRNTGAGIAGKNIANPCGFLFAAANMLKYLGLNEHSSVIKKAVLNTIHDHKLKTQDIGGTATTSEFIQCVLTEITQMTPQTGFAYEMQHAKSYN
ncbi:unnamed protein product [Rotaria magnacalcarata]|uniref:Isopropylmalate dehydrogenase-like domain-containing protein n=1 Tax=Rotaria magnacalcarata TaxID=392030 RepID=A0A819LWW7_9BILA|nr:unnamed protein product [Rotaria magnacalcarata]CAF1933519.1 unnamed protein product [Rotaria magnacalcarata]CAF1977768.1 unnamed protein product [Rotaria magnacalcarata]CAF3969400.1 unnamed protein product [Rotaria magnacalcarata]CAF3995473.1 unnamed protein product [Rotaria magnacalcarata]